ncbi:Serine/threonine-protein kinase [Actinidia chinensis var. chinensis]|uniref:Serine/threonine-protein kinase n=1 Tax=Actinidia chinensis var. chinensis TaxID=1590841 RepID=A0A2R6PDI8_ACTCC|nr:Serine/threonine-protein kinase [Actinidia chinensis var. chinensis]
MEGENAVPAGDHQYYCNWGVMSPEIVEIEDSKSFISSRDGVTNDVYVAVGKDDLDVVKWALDHAVSPGVRVFLVHVFPPVTYISTPVGRLSRSQLSQEQARFYVNEENNRRRNLLQKYIRLCTDAKVTVDTMLVESNATAKAILELIPVLNINHLVMGTKRPHASRRLMKGIGKGEVVTKNAPDYCEVTIVYEGKKLVDGQKVVPSALTSDRHQRPDTTRQSERNFFECICFSAKSD